MSRRNAPDPVGLLFVYSFFGWPALAVTLAIASDWGFDLTPLYPWDRLKFTLTAVLYGVAVLFIGPLSVRRVESVLFHIVHAASIGSCYAIGLLIGSEWAVRDGIATGGAVGPWVAILAGCFASTWMKQSRPAYD